MTLVFTALNFHSISMFGYFQLASAPQFDY